MHSLSNRPLRTWHYFCLGAVLGAIVFLLLYGISPLNVTNDSWLRNGYIEADIQQHYAGWLFYRQSPLTFPFCYTPNINWPNGISVAFTDSIPLFAALFRVLSPILPATFQYFGLYTFFCFMLQGGFAAILIQRFTSVLPAILTGSIPFVVSPILLERAFRHTALGAHFLVLGTLYYYIRGKQEKRFIYKGLFALNAITLAIHPYFAPMTYAITFVLFLEHCVSQKSWKKPLLFLISNLLVSLSVGWLFGLFQGGSTSGGSGIQYGYFCMNLNALWNPSSRGMSRWSLFLPTQNQVLGNYDGFNYLGLGVLLCSIVLGISVLIQRKTLCLFQRIREHWGLLLICICLGLFAASNIITANGVVLAKIPLPQTFVNLATTLRSSGRLFWPVYYLIYLVCIIGIIRVLQTTKQSIMIAALSMLVLVQVVDISPALFEKYNSMRDYREQGYNLLDSTHENGLGAFLSATESRYEHIIALDPLTKTGLTLALYTADHQMTSTDTSFVARYDETQAVELRTEYINSILNGTMPRDALFLTEQESTFLQLADSAKEQGAWCGVLLKVEDGVQSPLLYVIAPDMEYVGKLAKEYDEAYPLHIADYSDDYWDHGILSFNLEQIDRVEDKNRVVLFYDTPLARRKLENATALVANGVQYPIVSMSDKDAGWIMVTLEIEDAHDLYENGQSKDLESIA